MNFIINWHCRQNNVSSFFHLLRHCVYFFPIGSSEKKETKMAQTNPMPMGPWKVRQMTDNSSVEVCLVFSAELGLTSPVFTDHCV